MKVLFLTIYPVLQPSTRFRVVQFLPYLNKDIEYVIKPLMPEFIFNKLYFKNTIFKRFCFHFLEFFIRMKHVLCSFNYDVVFIQKGLTTMNFRFLLILLFLFNKNVIFDFDDAITTNQISGFSNPLLQIFQDELEWLKVVKKSAGIIVGNEKLAKDIEGLNRHIYVIPTVVDTNYYKVANVNPNKEYPIVILWSGNKSGLVYFDVCAPSLIKLGEKYPLEILILSDGFDQKLVKLFNNIKCDFVKWSIENEKSSFLRADIGIMPLYDTLWDRRKCAFKALLYMANGIPCVSSRVGVIRNIIKNGENGFLAGNDKEWFDRLEDLVVDYSLRKRVGLKGRETVEKEYSLSRWAPEFNNVLTSVKGNRR